MVEQNAKRGPEPTQSPDAKIFGNQIFNSIKDRLIAAGLQEKSAGLKPQDVFVPKLCKGLGTSALLEKMFGLSKDFSDRFVIFIKNEKNNISNDNIMISTGEEDVAGYGPKNSDLWVHLSELFSDRHKISDVHLKSTLKLGEKASFFQRQGMLNDIILLGNISEKEESALLVMDNADGVSQTFSLVLPAGWRDAVDEEGRLIEETEEKQSDPKLAEATREQAETPESKLQNEVLRRIKDQLILNGLLPAEKVNRLCLQDIYAPPITTGQSLSDRMNTQKILDKVGLSNGFSTIFMGKAGKEAEKGLVQVLGHELKYIHLGLYAAGGNYAGNKIADLVFDNEYAPSVFHNSLTIERSRILLGVVSPEEESVLLVSEDGVTSVNLPIGWQSVVNKGSGSIGKSVESIKQAVQGKTVEKPVVALKPEGQVFLKTPEKTKEPYTKEQLKRMRKEQWEDYDAMKEVAPPVHTGGERHHAGGNYTEKPAPISTVRKLLQDETIFPENIRPSLHVGNPRSGFKDRPDKERIDESRKYWAHKAEKRNRESKNSGKSKKGK